MQENATHAPARPKADSLASYLAILPNSKDLPPIEHAIRALVPSGKHRDIEALFDNRSAYYTIQCWRRGHRPAPQWARDLVQQKLAPYIAIERMIAADKGGPGKGINVRNIMAWHARQKEKSRNTAAL